MKLTPTIIASLALTGVAAAEFYRSPAVEACYEATVESLATNPDYDAFIPTEFLDRARILRWEAPFSEAHPALVATVVFLEGKARLLSDGARSDDVTTRCGLTDNKVIVLTILKGHGLSDDAQ